MTKTGTTLSDMYKLMKMQICARYLIEDPGGNILKNLESNENENTRYKNPQAI